MYVYSPLATALPDGKKGEKVVLLFAGDIGTASLSSLIAAADMHPLMLPAKLVKVDNIPKLGTGKNDFKRARAMALEAVA